MSSNDAIRITEQEDGTWEVLHYDVDQEIEKYRTHTEGHKGCFRCLIPSGRFPFFTDSLDAALDHAQAMTSEYGLEIVRLKDQKIPSTDGALVHAAQAHVSRLIIDGSRRHTLLFTVEEMIEAFIQGANYQDEQETHAPGCSVG